MNYYQHHIGDYRRDTTHLSLLEHGVYRQLLDMYYLSETKIPAETEAVYRRLCAKTDEEKKAVDTVLSEFFKRENGWVQTRCDKEIAEYQGKADRARINGKLGGRPSKTKEVISGNPEETESKANHKPITNNQEPVTNNQEPSEKQKPATATRLPTAKRKQSIPVDFKPTQRHHELAASLSVNLTEELPQFCDHHLANGSVMASWDAALSKWIRNAAKWGGKAGATKFLTAQQQRDENNRRSTAEFLADDSPFFGSEPEAIEGEFNHA